MINKNCVVLIVVYISSCCSNPVTGARHHFYHTLTRFNRALNETTDTLTSSINSIGTRKLDRDVRGNLDFVFPTNAPVEVRNQIYSEDVVNYPTDLIKQMNFDSFKSFFVNFDYVETSLLDIRKENELTSEEFCNSISRKIRPREGVNKDNAKRLIINYEELKQEFSIEECSQEYQTSTRSSKECKFHSHFPSQFVKSECKQFYSYRRLVSLNSKNETTLDHFKFPSHCKCLLWRADY